MEALQDPLKSARARYWHVSCGKAADRLDGARLLADHLDLGHARMAEQPPKRAELRQKARMPEALVTSVAWTIVAGVAKMHAGALWTQMSQVGFQRCDNTRELEM